jgi:hypothetical protein
VTGLDACLALVLGVLEAGPRRGETLSQLARAHAQRAQGQVQVLELTPDQGDRHPETLLHHLGVALRATALPRQAAHLRLHFGDEVPEPGQVGGCLFEPPLVALLAVAVQPDPRRFLEQRPPLLGSL